MKKKELNELKGKEVKDLDLMLTKKKAELAGLTAKMYAGKENDLKKYRGLKLDISQISTILNAGIISGNKK